MAFCTKNLSRIQNIVGVKHTFDALHKRQGCFVKFQGQIGCLGNTDAMFSRQSAG